MPITLEQFEVQFDKLQAAFGTVKPSKILEQWFTEFESEDYFTFLTAMKRSQYGQRFPTWEMFKAELRNSRGVAVREEYKGCGKCEKGVVLFKDINRHGKITEQAANCAKCSEGKLRDMASVHPEKLHRDAVDTLRTQRALKQERADGVRIEEPRVQEAETPKPMEMVRNIYGVDDPANERKRYGSLKREEEREANVAYEF